MNTCQLATETFYVMPTPSSSSTFTFCIFCLKNESKNSNSKNERKKKTLQHSFFEMLQKHFEEKATIAGCTDIPEKVGFPFSEVADKLKVISCMECFPIIESYCDIYEKIKCLKMQLDWQLDKLNKAVKYADNDLSKLCAFHDWCYAQKGGETEYMEFRRQFQNQCKLSKLTCFPQVPLRRICTRNASRLDKGSIQENLNSFSNDHIQNKTCFESKRKNSLTKKTGPSTKKFKNEYPEDELSNTDQCQVDFAVAAVMIKEENSTDDALVENSIDDDAFALDENSIDDNTFTLNENSINVPLEENSIDEDFEENSNDDDFGKVESPIDNESDPDWFENDDYDDDKNYGEKVTRKRNNAGKSKKPKTRSSKRVKTRKKKVLRGRKAIPIESDPNTIFTCQKCPAKSRPHFFSVNALQIHQKYLHSNGYELLSNTENSEVLRLTEEHLTLHGFQVSLNSCSDSFSDCPQKFWSLEELTNHLKYHGHFTCETCSTIKSNAVDMAIHELSHHKEKIQSTTETSVHKTPCGKCEFSTLVKGELINHYLEFHMDKPPIQATCPICQQRFRFVEKVPLLHYLNYHDLTRLEDPSSTGIKCMEDKCHAYFLTEDQLQQHFRSSHGKFTELVAEEKRLQTVAKKTKQKAMKYKSRGYICSCEFCERSFRAENELKAHTWRHHANEKWGPSCGQIKLTEDGLTIDEFGIGNKCVCDICENVFSGQVQLEKHKLHHGEFKCNFCTVVKSLATELAIHETVHNIESKEGQSVAGDSFKCPRCLFTTRKRPEYVDHFLESHLSLSSDRKKCPICRKLVPDLVKSGLGKLGQRNWMVGHYMEVHDKTGLDSDLMPKCHLCPGYFRTPVQLDNHYKEIHGKHRYECSDCGKIFDKRIRLQRHRIKAHKADPSTFPFVCSFPECGSRFETVVELGYHETGAHNEKDVAVQFCPQCGKQCSGNSQLASHLKTHLKEKVKKQKKELSSESTVCEECGKYFATRKYLMRHRYRHAVKKGLVQPKKVVKKTKVKIESEEAPSSPPEAFVCEVCGKIYETQRQLWSHRFRHKGPECWNFKCSVCSKKFSTKYKLDVHVRKHTKEKPYLCKICSAKFGFPQNLRAHMKTVHKEFTKLADLSKIKK